MRVLALSEIWNRELRGNEGTSRIDRLDQVIALDRHLLNADRIDCTSIVNQDVQATECLNGLLHGSLDTICVPDVALNCQGSSTKFLYLLRRRIDGSRKFWMRCDRLGSDRNVSSIFCAALGNLQADATRGPRDEDCLATKRL